jgi:hypothetical protein
MIAAGSSDPHVGACASVPPIDGKVDAVKPD